MPWYELVSAGGYHSCGLVIDGSLRCFGNLERGQLNVPVGVTFSSMSVGVDFTCGVRMDNQRIACWGDNTNGVISQVPSGVFRSVHSGFWHACALRHDGRPQCWGSNLYNALQIPTNLNFSTLSAGCGLLVNSSLVCWFTVPQLAEIPRDEPYREVTVGWYQTCVLRMDRSVLCVGMNDEGQLNVPTGVLFRTISCGERYCCGLVFAPGMAADSTARCWGKNNAGQTNPPAGVVFSSLSAGGWHACGIERGSNAAICWGFDAFGRIAPPPLARALWLKPHLVLDDTAVYDAMYTSGSSMRFIVSRGSDGTLSWRRQLIPLARNATTGPSLFCELSSSGITTCVSYGRQGSGSFVFDDSSDRPRGLVALATAVCWLRSDERSIRCRALNGTVLPLALSNVTAPITRLYGGQNHVCALLITGSAVCSGSNGTGQCAAPRLQFTELALGADFTCGLSGLTSDIVCWGGPYGGSLALGVGQQWAHVYASVALVCGVNASAFLYCWKGLTVTLGPIALPAAAARADEASAIFLSRFETVHPHVLTYEQFSLSAPSNMRVPDWSGFPGQPLLHRVLRRNYAQHEQMMTWSTMAATIHAARAPPSPWHVDFGGVSFSSGLQPAQSYGWPRLVTHVSLTAANVCTLAAGAFGTAAPYLQRLDLPVASDAAACGHLQLTAGSLANMTRLASINSDTIGVANLSRLSAFSTDMGTFSLDALDGLSLITHVDLTGNNVSVIRTGQTDTRLPGIAVVRLDAPRRPRTLAVDSGVFTSLPNLRSINSLEAGVMNLSHTGIFVEGLHPECAINLDIFDGCANVRTVRLDGLSICELLPMQRQRSSIEHLWLDVGDSLSLALHSGSFPPLTRTVNSISDGTINLRRTGAFAAGFSRGVITLDIFSGMNLSSVLDLSDNNVSELLPSSLASRLPPGIRAVLIENHRFASAANVSNVLRSLFTTRALSFTYQPVQLSLAYGLLSTLGSSDFDGLVRMDQLNLGGNRIEFISADTFTNAKHPFLTSLMLNGNPITTGTCPPGYFNDISVLAAGATVPVCMRCPSGAVCQAGLLQPCAAGRYNDLTGQLNESACLQCPSGTFNELTGQTRFGCVMCGAGSASRDAGAASASQCEACVPGRYAPTQGLSECFPCLPGTYNELTGANAVSLCTPCPLGRYSSSYANSNASDCVMCPSGTTTALPGATSIGACIAPACPAGYGRGDDGECMQCQPGRFSTLGDSSCTPCPAGRFTAAAASASCELCPAATHRSGEAGDSVQACTACPRGTLAAPDRKACRAICLAGTILSPLADVDAVTATYNESAVRSRWCMECPAAAHSRCMAGVAEVLLNLAEHPKVSNDPSPVVVAAPQPRTGGSRHANTETANVASCGDFAQAQLSSSPSQNFASIRFSVLLTTLFLAIAVPAVMALMTTCRASKGPNNTVARLDAFSRQHPVAYGGYVRNVPNFTGGLFTVGFGILALGVSCSIVAQAFAGGFSVTQSVVDTPPVQLAPELHVGSVLVQYLLLGPHDASCNGQVSNDTLASGWRLVDANVASWSSIASSFDLRQDFVPPSAPACLMSFVCKGCRMTQQSSIAFSVPWTFQSAAIAVSSQAALAGCSPQFKYIIAAPDSSTFVEQVTVHASVRPVMLRYSGSVGAGRVTSGFGHDVVFSTSASRIRSDSTLLQPDTDRMHHQLVFTPVPHSSLIVVADNMDTLQVVTTILGFVSGLAAAIRLLMSFCERLWRVPRFLSVMQRVHACVGCQTRAHTSAKAAAPLPIDGPVSVSLRSRWLQQVAGGAHEQASSSSRAPAAPWTFNPLAPTQAQQPGPTKDVAKAPAAAAAPYISNPVVRQPRVEEWE